MRQKKILFLFMVTSIAASSYVAGSESLDIMRTQNRMLNEVIADRDDLKTRLQEVMDADLPSRLAAIPRLQAEVDRLQLLEGQVPGLQLLADQVPLHDATIAQLRMRVGLLVGGRNTRDATIGGLNADVDRLQLQVLQLQAALEPQQPGALAPAPQQAAQLQAAPVLRYATWAEAKEAGLSLGQFKAQ